MRTQHYETRRVGKFQENGVKVWFYALANVNGFFICQGSLNYIFDFLSKHLRDLPDSDLLEINNHLLHWASEENRECKEGSRKTDNIEVGGTTIRQHYF